MKLLNFHTDYYWLPVQIKLYTIAAGMWWGHYRFEHQREPWQYAFLIFVSSFELNIKH
jgi:hypothetical protein